MTSLRKLSQKSDSSMTARIATPVTSKALEDSLPPPVLANSNSISIRRKKKARVGGLAVHWARFKRRVGTGTAPSSSSLVGESTGESNNYLRREGPLQDDGGEVDEVVVDRIWSEDIKSSTTHSEHGASPEKSGGSHPMGQSASDRGSLAPEGFWSTFRPIVFLRWRLWPKFAKIFVTRFADEKSEAQYEQENWFMKKSPALWASLWLIVNWVLGCIFTKPLYQHFDRIFYFGALQAIGLFGLKMNRLPAAIGACTFFIT
ncbi:hypothetical protein DXG03_007510 [Asterophora parasitica]|uniref:Uncharacterized protein n=1 Tax=Asterophora parasitica TaxID=117018 RepID=A0A9P7G8J8_9AGAR|nr:hypothetical protein DXG03_007510 [Asterophora parasitica]